MSDTGETLVRASELAAAQAEIKRVTAQLDTVRADRDLAMAQEEEQRLELVKYGRENGSLRARLAEVEAELARTVEQNGNLRELFAGADERWLAADADARRLKQILED